MLAKSKITSTQKNFTRFLNKAITVCLLVVGVVTGATFYPETPVVHAEETEKPAMRIQVSPTDNRVSLNKGETNEYSFNVDNTGTESYDFKVYVTPYSVTNEKYSPNFSNETSHTMLRRWIDFKNEAGEYVKENTYTVEPGQRKEVHYRITVPADIPGGGQYAMIFVEAIPKTDNNTGGIRTISRLGYRVFGRTNGETKESAEILNHNMDSFYTSGKVRMTGSVKNDGNADFNAIFKIKVEKIFGGVVYEDSKGYDVLPETTRTIEMLWEDTPAFGIYRITSSMNALDKSSSTTKIVLIIPIFMIVILLMLLTITIAWFIILYRKRQAQKSKLII